MFCLKKNYQNTCFSTLEAFINKHISICIKKTIIFIYLSIYLFIVHLPMSISTSQQYVKDLYKKDKRIYSLN